MGNADRLCHRGHGIGVFRADVEVTLVRADCKPSDGHAFHENEGVALHEHAIRERPAVAFISVAGDELELRRHVQNRLPLDTCGEARPAPAPKAGVGHHRHDLLRRHLERPAQSREAPGRLVVSHREGIGDPDSFERETRLPSQVGDLLGRPQAQPMRRAFEHPSVEELTNALGLDRAVGDTPFRSGDFNERLEPEHPARTVAHEADFMSTDGRLPHDRGRYVLGADRTSGGVQRHEYDGRFHQRAFVRQEATSSSKPASSTLPFSRPSTSTAGESAAIAETEHLLEGQSAV